MLIWRFISGLTIVIGLTLLVSLDIWLGDQLGIVGLVTFPLTIVIAVMAAGEVLWLQDNFETKPNHWLVYIATVLVVASAFVPILWREYPSDCSVGRLGWMLFGVAAASGLILTVEMFHYQKPGSNVLRIALAMMVVCYVGLLFSFIGPLRLYHDNRWGMLAILSMLVPVKVSDMCAYGFGKIFGRHKFAPILSPGKTIEGVCGSFVGGILGTMLVFFVLLPLLTGQTNSAPIWLLILFGMLMTALGIAGDLVASVLKRDGGEKNSSRWLPGLGGVLDIIDSPLAVMPAAYAFWASGLLGPVQPIS